MKKKIGDLTVLECIKECRKHNLCGKDCVFYDSIGGLCMFAHNPHDNFNNKEVEVPE